MNVGYSEMKPSRRFDLWTVCFRAPLEGGVDPGSGCLREYGRSEEEGPIDSFLYEKNSMAIRTHVEAGKLQPDLPVGQRFI